MIQSQTVTLPEVATQLPLWLNQTMSSRPPLWLRTTENPEPVAVIIETEAYKQSQKQSSLLYQWQIANLAQWLDRIERQWDNQLLREECVQVWKEMTWKLWEVAPKPVQEFLAGLTMSAKSLEPQTLTKRQVAALRNALEAVRDGEGNPQRLEDAHQDLVNTDIAPLLSFDEDLIQLYLDEL